jgi:NitT/TauT family transport system substrate-binding protein
VLQGQAKLPGRRRLLQSVGAFSVALSGGSLLTGCANQVAPFFGGSSSARPETTTIRFPARFTTCVAPEQIAADLLRSDGYDVKFVSVDLDFERAVSAGEIDFGMQAAASTTIEADREGSFVHLAGIHVGCFELFAGAGIQSMSGLKGKRVAVSALGAGPHVHMAMMAAYVGLDPNRDFTWMTGASDELMDAFAAGQVDGFMGFPPEPQLLRNRGMSNVLVKTHTDRPWSQHFCCGLIANRAFVQNNPVATKQTLRAILKAADLCAQDPAGMAQRLVDRGVASDYGSALQTLSHDVAYDRWREYDPEATIRFYALLLHQIGMVKSTPDKIVAQSTDWRFLNELKRELKG